MASRQCVLFWHLFPAYDTMRADMIPTKLEIIYEPIAEVLSNVRSIVAQTWRETLRLVQITAPLADQSTVGGKLLRPALCLLSAGTLGEKDLCRFVRLAAAYEAMHIASLAHDDVVDHASLRRGQYALNALWNEQAAVLGGDFLVARALQLMLEYNSIELVRATLDAVQRMAEGELRFFGKKADDLTPSDCISLADTKTGSLFAAACSGPAQLLDPSGVPIFHAFGISLGIAFQLIDDLLDITQTEEMLGKPSCGDITEGKFTLPLYLLRERLSQQDRQRLDSMYGATLTNEDRSWILTCTAKTKIVEDIREMARGYVEQAISALSQLPESPFKRSMVELSQFILIRGY